MAGSTGTGVGLIVMGAFLWVSQWNFPDDNDFAHRVRQVSKLGSAALILAGAALAAGIFTT